MKKLSLIIALLSCSLLLQAVPAKPGFFRYVQPDGSAIMIQRHGDEWGHWTTNEQGQVVSQGSDGFYRVVNGMDTATASRVAGIRRKAKRQMMASARPQAPIALGQKHFLLVLVEFNDRSFTIDNPQQTIGDMLNQKGYSQNGATGSASDYYYDNSLGVFDPIFDVYGPVKLSRKAAYYGENDKQGYDKHPADAVKEACQALDSSVNFADYDMDGDGEVDLVYMVYAGKGEADGGDEDTIWPHQWYLTAAGITLKLDGKQVDRYACGSELSGSGKLDGIGTICHEFGHAIGLPDFYDTDNADNGTARTLLGYSLMDGGSYNNNGWTPPYLNMEERIMLGWLDESALPEFPEEGNYTLKPVQNNVAYKTMTDKEGEYFVYECRTKTGWDKSIPAAGLIVYHVDKSARMVSIEIDGTYYDVSAAELWSDWGMWNAINESGKHPCFYVVAAAAPQDIMYGMVYNPSYGYYFSSSYAPSLPFPGSKKVTKFQAVSWNAWKSEFILSNIVYANNEVSFTVKREVNNPLDYPVIANPGKGKYAAGSEFGLTLHYPEGYKAESVKWLFDGAAVQGSAVTLAAGAHVVEAELGWKDGKKVVVSLEIDVN